MHGYTPWFDMETAHAVRFDCDLLLSNCPIVFHKLCAVLRRVNLSMSNSPLKLCTQLVVKLNSACLLLL